MADCPFASDETDCSCADLDMHDCLVNGAHLCFINEWSRHDEVSIHVCQNELTKDVDVVKELVH